MKKLLILIFPLLLLTGCFKDVESSFKDIEDTLTVMLVEQSCTNLDKVISYGYTEYKVKEDFKNARCEIHINNKVFFFYVKEKELVKFLDELARDLVRTQNLPDKVQI
jgi:hypothetical protein